MPTPAVQRVLTSTAIAALALASSLSSNSAEAATPFTAFESGQVRPLALSPNGKYLFAVNTPDNRLETYEVTSSGLIHQSSVTVGLEPVAVAARSDTEVWVVNHLSDSVSVVNVSTPTEARVARTLLVGDEPRDIVFAGPSLSRAFITTAHRGQNVPYDPQLTTPGVGRADVWVFDATASDNSLTGTPLTILKLFTDTPRALAVSPDGSKVYAAGFHTGNRTTSIHRKLVTAGGGRPAPQTNYAGEAQPEVALIVKHNGQHWVDETGTTWDDEVKLTLPDKDVFVINATSSPPALVAGAAGSFSGVGTILFNMAVNPVSGKIYVSNTDANNSERFAGPGVFAGTTLRGRFSQSRISVLSAGGVATRHLNKHINYSSCCAPIPNAENSKSLATPVGMAVSPTGTTLYVAALGSSKVGIFKTSELESNTFVPSVANQIPVTGGGPTGLVLNSTGSRLYVLTRFDNSISIINTTTRVEIGHVAMHNPEPASVKTGRRFLYDASFTSSHGDSSCASCHVFGDLDSLAWDLGDPDGDMMNNPGPIELVVFPDPGFRPMKGPMTTQSLRGMANHGPLHWRGDRTGGDDEASAQPESGSFDEHAGFMKFQEAFTGLMGRHAPIPQADMQAFADFMLQVMYPPNPIRALDNSLTPDQQAGRDHIFAPGTGGPEASCTTCHALDVEANAEFDVPFPGFFGTDGQIVVQETGQDMKIAHFRNLYQKVGMFGMGSVPTIIPGDNQHMGDQIRGFGYTHDGSHDTVFRFTRTVGFDKSIFTPNGFDDSPGGNGEVRRRQVEKFLLAFDSNLAPVVGQQVTLTPTNSAAINPRINLLIARAEAGECDLVAKAYFLAEEHGYLYIGGGLFAPNRQIYAPLTDAKLRSYASANQRRVTYTCVPPGSGERVGIDRDGDGFRDGDELDACKDPANPLSHP